MFKNHKKNQDFNKYLLWKKNHKQDRVINKLLTNNNVN